MESVKEMERQMLALVRASLWQQPVDAGEFADKCVDWQSIGRLALQQTVGCLVFEGALSLPAQFRPPKEWIRKAVAFMEGNRRTHILLDRCVAESVVTLREEGIAPVLLKGQAYARAYPRPGLRQCGDIDLYVGEDSYRPVYEAVRRIGWESEEKFHPDAKHYGCTLHGIRIELHRIAGMLPSGSADRRFQQWSRSLLASPGRSLTIGGKEIAVPAPIFDVIFVFLHLYHHFQRGGIGLRQICDWTMLLHVHAGEIDLRELEVKLTEFRLMKAWRRFAPIAVDHLGLPESECPFYSAENRSHADRILRFVLKEGNFGIAVRKGSVRPKGYVAGKAYSFRRNCSAMLTKLSVDPATIARTYMSYVKNGLSRVFKDIMERD